MRNPGSRRAKSALSCRFHAKKCQFREPFMGAQEFFSRFLRYQVKGKYRTPHFLAEGGPSHLGGWGPTDDSRDHPRRQFEGRLSVAMGDAPRKSAQGKLARGSEGRWIYRDRRSIDVL